MFIFVYRRENSEDSFPRFHQTHGGKHACTHARTHARTHTHAHKVTVLVTTRNFGPPNWQYFLKCHSHCDQDVLMFPSARKANIRKSSSPASVKPKIKLAYVLSSTPLQWYGMTYCVVQNNIEIVQSRIKKSPIFTTYNE